MNQPICHPGCVDPDYPSGCSVEREAELCALRAPHARRVLHEAAIQVVSYRNAGHRLKRAPA